MSLIEEQMVRLKREAEERSALRAASRAETADRDAGIFSVSETRVAELAPSAASFDATKAALAAFDYTSGTPASFLELIFSAGTHLQVSDIHCEPEDAHVRVRFRMDGVLHDAGAVPENFYRLMLPRLKLTGGMKLNAERPQDGRLAVRMGSDSFEARISTVPSRYGETSVIRLLDPRTIAIPLEGLGLRADDLAIVVGEVAMPNGMIAVAGPTGSGKTTTLYALLKRRLRPEEKIVTIEDPIEYSVRGIEQTQVDAEAGYSFPTGLRAIVRQDPDVIVVGEMRDAETAEIAMQAALTGHLVLSSVHANSAAGTIPRLIDMGVKGATVGPAVNCVIAQRLVRRLCSMCRREVEISDDFRARIMEYAEALPIRADRSGIGSLFAAVGCLECNGTGYKGRIGLFEVMRVGDELERLVNSGANEGDIRCAAVAAGMVSMQGDGVLKALHGITTVEEVEAATGPLPFKEALSGK